MQEYDYVIIGGGSAGSVLAARLSEDSNVSVCLLEAGGKARSLLVRTPAMLVTVVRGKPKINNWAFRTTPQQGFDGRCGHQPRGKGLGGSSAINAMLYIRGQAQDYDSWAQAGCTGWSYDEVLPYFIKSENNQHGASQYHGGSGPLHVANQPSARPATYHFIKAAQNCGYPFNDDFNGAVQEGVGLYQVTQFHSGKHKGERCSAAAAYLHPVMYLRKNLTVITHAEVAKILIKEKKAIGAEYQYRGQMRQVRAKREVLLCAGAIKSPQILMLSGIGDEQHLQQHGIECLYHNPNVGANLQDHLDFILAYKAKDNDYFGLGFISFWRLFKAIFPYTFQGIGRLTTPYAEGAGFIKSKKEMDRPDLQLHFLIALSEEHGRKLRWGYGFACHVCVLRPKSRGNIRLASNDFRADPLIDMNFLSHPDDSSALLDGVKKMREIMQTEPLAQYIKSEIYTQDAKSDEALMAHIKQRADTIYHPVGTCKMAVDETAVVNPDLEVLGIQNLRVIDASIMPNVLSGNTNAPTIMIAEKMADKIKAQYAEHRPFSGSL